MRRRIFPVEEENNLQEEISNIEEAEAESYGIFGNSSYTWLFIIIIVIVLFGDFKIY